MTIEPDVKKEFISPPLDKRSNLLPSDNNVKNVKLYNVNGKLIVDDLTLSVVASMRQRGEVVTWDNVE